MGGVQPAQPQTADQGWACQEKTVGGWLASWEEVPWMIGQRALPPIRVGGERLKVEQAMGRG